MKHSIDAHVGQRVRQRRWMLGMTQQQLGDMIGITISQIRNYENGANRIGASRMWNVAAALKVPAAFFFEGFDGRAPDTGETRGDVLTDKEAHELVRAYYSIPENQRRRLSDLAGVLRVSPRTGAQFFDTGQAHRAERDVASAEQRT